MKNIEEYNFPSDLKEMSIDEMDILSYGIRSFLLEKISKTGGHLASNLGVVELTLAMHKIFDSPRDKFIWDVGHQSYVHKILTGRMSDFDTLRTFGGLSGFPKRCESNHDIYETGHASNSISAASGIAAARDIQGENYHVLAVIGDGSMSGGLSFEGLNNLGSSNSKVIVILNDNGMSISPNVGGLSEHLGKVRTSPKYKKTKGAIGGAVEKIPYVGGSLKSGIGEAKDWVKYALVSEGIFFEELGFTYLGPIDGHNLEDLTSAMEQAKQSDKSVLLHVVTKKGKGYKNAENTPDKFHGIGSFDLNTGDVLKKGKPGYSKVFGDKLLSMAMNHKDIVGISAAMCNATGLDPFKQYYPKRFFDVGIAEAHGVSFAAGMAINGIRPYVAIYSTFLQRGYDQIIEDVALHNVPVTFAIDRAGVVGADGETHHGIFDLAYMLPVPNMTVYAPATKDDLKKLLEKSYNLNSPCGIRYPRGAYKVCQNIKIPGENQRIESGKDLDIVAVGPMIEIAIEARQRLKKQGIDAGIIYACVLKGEGEDLPVEDGKLVVTLEDHLAIGGYGSYLKSKINNPTLILGWPDSFVVHGSVEELLKEYRLDAQGVTERIVEEFERKA